MTPGWGVAGAVLIATGVAYTLVGIKNRWVHTFFSSAYLAALGISVLIVYLMNVPISDGLQGGYVAAVIFPACLVGGASVFFKELTEGLGCALGGFSVSMWLLCLVPGGLLGAVAQKAIFIACFTLGGFGFYFSKYTRDWALILMISFAGATVIVLGIDCFSRAGLKEFWAYVWDLNDDLFPLGARTYPVTKGIRVETAAVIIFLLFGIISQIKLWRIVREQKARRAADREAEKRDLEQQEEHVGRTVEETNARERRQWEQAHGDGDLGSLDESQISVTGGEKKMHHGQEAASKRTSGVDVIEMSEMSGSDYTRAPVPLMEEQDKEGKVTIRVAEDDTLPAPMIDERSGNGATSPRLIQSTSPRSPSVAERHVSEERSITEVPDVIPLPFTVPLADDARSRGDRSSVATFADDERAAEASPRHRHSIVKRLSQGSGNLLRSFSQRSAVSGNAVQGELSGSSEDLVVSRSRRLEVDDGSVAATADDSLSCDERRLSDDMDDKRKSIEITAELSERSPQLGGPEPESSIATPAQQKHLSNLTVSTGIVGTESPADGPRSPALQSVEQSVGADRASVQDVPEKSKSATSALSSTPVSLTKDRLPKSLSKVALSYRTNEWAKHLSHAETPEPEKLEVARSRASISKRDQERAVPLNVQELQQTAEEGVPALDQIKTSASRDSLGAISRSASKTANRQSLTGTIAENGSSSEEVALQKRNSVSSINSKLTKSPSANALGRASNFQPIVEENQSIPQPSPNNVDALLSGSPAQSSPTVPSDSFQSKPVPGVVSYDSPQTLIGQRDMFLRSRSQGNLMASTSNTSLNSFTTPMPPASDSGSMYNYPAYAAALGADADDVPLSQRKEFMRQSSLMSLTGNKSGVASKRASFSAEPSQPSIVPNFDSHQPQRVSTLPSQIDREARLASFRNSVAQDLRSGTPLMTPSGRETPFASTHSLLAGGREAEVQRNIEVQRSIMLGQREAEGQQKEMVRRQKEWADRAFDERMRNGELLDVHREAMRKMQKSAKDQ